MKVLVTGATGSIGRHVVDEAIGQGHEVRALVRGPGKLKPRPGLKIVVADLIQPPTLAVAVEGLDAVVFTHGTYGSPPAMRRPLIMAACALFSWLFGTVLGTGQCASP